jgi:hypothetical protein
MSVDKGGLKYVGLWKLRAPLYHGAPVMDREWLQRRRRNRGFQHANHSLLREGQVACVIEEGTAPRLTFRPVYEVSGNSMRGLLHAIVARHTLLTLGLPTDWQELKEKFGWQGDDEVALLFKGGPMVAGDVENLERRKRLREKLPIVDLFGGCYRGESFRSMLRMDFAVPAVREVAQVWPEFDDLLADQGLSWDALPTEAELRNVVENNPYWFARHIPEELAGLVWEEEVPEGASRDVQKARMVFSLDAIPAGMLMFHRFALLPGASDRARWCLEAAVHLWLTEYDGVVGGGAARGFGGLVQARYRKCSGDVLGDVVDFERGYEEYTKWLETNKNSILEYLARLPLEFPGRPRRGGSRNGQGGEPAGSGGNEDDE